MVIVVLFKLAALLKVKFVVAAPNDILACTTPAELNKFTPSPPVLNPIPVPV